MCTGETTAHEIHGWRASEVLTHHVMLSISRVVTLLLWLAVIRMVAMSTSGKCRMPYAIVPSVLPLHYISPSQAKQLLGVAPKPSSGVLRWDLAQEPDG